MTAIKQTKVSLCRDVACAQPTHDKTTAAAGSHGLKLVTATVVSAKATRERKSPPDQQGGRQCHLARVTEKDGAGRPELPAAPDQQDIFLQACVTARENGLRRVVCKMIVRDVFNAPWSFDEKEIQTKHPARGRGRGACSVRSAPTTERASRCNHE